MKVSKTDNREAAAAFIAALAHLNLLQVRMTGEPIMAARFPDQLRALLLATRDKRLIQEAFRTGRGFAWCGDGPPTKQNIVPLRLGPMPTQVDKRAVKQLDVALTLRIRDAATRQGTSRESQGRRARSAASASRDGPLPPAEDADEDLAALVGRAP
jgi:hypothetical protein